MSQDQEKRLSPAQLFQTNRTCLLVSMAVMAMVFMACLVMGVLALLR